MYKRNSYKACMSTSGIENFDFDIDKEKAIYLYVCKDKMSRKSWKNLEEKVQFNTYKEWQNYVETKYSILDSDALQEFLRYLKHRKQMVSPTKEFSVVAITNIFSVFMACLVSFLLQLSIDTKFEGSYILLQIIMYFFLLVFLVSITIIGVLCFINKLNSTIWGNNSEYNLFADYEEIIENVMAEKMKER